MRSICVQSERIGCKAREVFKRVREDPRLVMLTWQEEGYVEITYAFEGPGTGLCLDYVNETPAIT